MSYVERIRGLATRAPKLLDQLKTEEAAKNALVMPFIAALGYDVFDPGEVIPEYIADVGVKKGEKVDYAIKRGDEIIMLIEAKPAGSKLSTENASQLYRYFSVTKSRIALLTNGTTYRLFSDLDEPNKLDTKPFLEIDLLDLRDNLLSELGRLTKDGFDLDAMLSSANDLKYQRELKHALQAQLDAPDEDFVRLLHTKVTSNARFTQGAREMFTPLVQRAFALLVADKISDRLRHALATEDSLTGRLPPAEAPAEAPPEAATTTTSSKDADIVTTEEELEGFRVVRAITCSVLPRTRVGFRDAKSYFSILCDDNNRKPICRLHFNRGQKYLGLFDDAKTETRHPIEDVDDLYQFADALRLAAAKYIDA